MFRLSHIVPDEVHRDCEFSSTGFVDSKIDGTLCCAANKRFLKKAAGNPSICAVVVTQELVEDVPMHLGAIVSGNPLRRFYELHNLLVVKHRMGMLPNPQVADSANVDKSAIVGSNVVIGEGAIIGPGAIVDNCLVAKGVSIGPGAMVGVDGHFFKQFDNEQIKVEHGGIAQLDDGAQVLAGAIVQRSVFAQNTIVGAASVVGPQVLVGHGVTIGKQCILAGGSQIAGYTSLGNMVWIGPGAVISNLIEIGDNARIEIGAVVVKSVPERGRQSGAFAGDHSRNLRRHVELWSNEND